MRSGGEADRDEPRILPLFNHWRTLDGVARGRLSSYWRTALAEDAELKDAVMVIEMVFGTGHRSAVSTIPLLISSTNLGTNHASRPFLVAEPEVTNDFSLGDGTSSARSLAFTVHPDAIPVQDMLARGEMLAGFGEVYLTRPDGEYDERKVLMRGDMDGGIRFGAPREPIDLELTDPKITADSSAPPWVITTDRWSAPNDSAVGARVPIVVNGAEGMPCPQVDTGSPDRFLVGYGHGFTLDGQYIDGASSALGSLVEGVDGLGLPITTIDYASGISGDTVSVNVDVSLAGQGFGIIEIIEHLLTHYSQIGYAGLNRTLFAAASARLRLAESPHVVLNDPAMMLSYIEGGLLDEWPMISMAWEGKGYGPIVTDVRADPVGEFIVGTMPVIDRATAVEEVAKADMLNSFVLRYDYDPIADVYKKVVVRNARNSTICRWSRDQIGERYDGERVAVTYREASTAGFVIDWLVEHFARPSYYLEYTCLPLAFWLLRRGDTIRITDAELAWTRERAVIERMVYRRGRCTVGLRVYPDHWARIGGSARSYPPLGAV